MALRIAGLKFSKPDGYVTRKSIPEDVRDIQDLCKQRPAASEGASGAPKMQARSILAEGVFTAGGRFCGCTSNRHLPQ
jgi:hypothetical protein